MRRFASALFVLLLLALAASACGGSAAPGQPGQDAPLPATDTPAPKAGTPVPPSPTPQAISPPTGKRVLANGVWTCPANTAGAMYVGSLDEKEYHKLDCPTAEAIAAQSRVCFVDEQVALKFGYVPAQDCSPP
jgi:hypothetical protein